MVIYRVLFWKCVVVIKGYMGKFWMIIRMGMIGWIGSGVGRVIIFFEVIIGELFRSFCVSIVNFFVVLGWGIMILMRLS